MCNTLRNHSEMQENRLQPRGQGDPAKVIAVDGLKLIVERLEK